MTDTLAELQRLAKEAQDEYWFFPGVVASYSKGWITKEEDAYIAACSPERILRLVMIAQAATMALHYHEGLAAINQSDLSKFDVALREALGKKP